MREESLNRSGGMWLVSFCVTAGAALCGHMSWLSALAGGIGAILLYELRLKLPAGKAPGLIAAVQVLWLAVPLAVFAGVARDLFQDASNEIYVPLVVLALSWLLARHPRDGVLACCVIVAYFLLAAVAVVCVFSLPGVQWRWLSPSFDWMEALTALAIAGGGMALSTAVPGVKPGRAWRWIAFLCPAAIAAVVAGNLSSPLAARQAGAFYTLSRSISLFGVVERFEALVASCLTLGLCGACALLLHAGRKLIPAKGRDGVTAFLCFAALGGSFLRISPLIPVLGTILVWALLPQIKSKKDEKSS
ncbi:MAG: hypothetical protein E7464_06040 [Ruminococcaceae bacterium]|nr:hypothetical protein [Oscillospiraceae bacterium]